MKKLIFILIMSLVFLGADVDLRNTLSVSGEGDYEVKPDVVYLAIGVQRDGITAKEAQEVHKRAINNILETLAKNNIERDFIKTDSYSIYPIYKRNKEDYSEQEIIKYRAYVRLTTELTQVTELGKIIDDIVKSGSNKIEGITYSVKNDALAKEEALRIAMQNVKSKATLIAKEMGIEIIKPLNISEAVNIYGNSRPLYKMELAAVESAPLDLPSGLVKIKANINVTYEIKPKEKTSE